MTQEEQGRLRVLNLVLEGHIGVGEAVQVLGVSERHAWRILAAYRKEGAAALAHGNRGRRPVNATPDEVRLEVARLASTRYAGFNHSHLAELLAEREGLVLGRSTVRSILVGAGIGSPRCRRAPRHRCRRQRMPREGMLLQMDGSEHAWLEERGPDMSLLLAVDDATGTVPWALFHQQEDTEGYFLLLWGIIENCGIPLAVYSDRHAVFQQTRSSLRPVEHLAGEQEPTQFGRALRELGVRQIFARSPEAKGRIERLAGTFQDRLVSELRLGGASTLAEANGVLRDFLPRFNQRFGVPPAETGSAYRPVDPDMDLASIICFKHHRKVARDNTVKYEWRTLQLFPGQDRTSYAGARVEVQKRLNGSLAVCYQGLIIPTQEAPPRPAALRARYGWPGDEAITCPLGLVGGVRPDTIGAQQEGVGMLGAACEGAAYGSPPWVWGAKTSHPIAPRRPTPRQQALWDAVQDAKRQGLSLRAIVRALGISRNTVRRYVAAGSPPVYPERRPGENGLEREAVLTESLNS